MSNKSSDGTFGRHDTFAHTVCPRCGGGIPHSGDLRGRYPGALSRKDNDTEVCSGCGTDEAMRQAFSYLGSRDPWPGYPGFLDDRLPVDAEVVTDA